MESIGSESIDKGGRGQASGEDEVRRGIDPDPQIYFIK